MVAPVSISGKEGKLKGQLARAVAKLKKAKLGGNPQVIKAAELRVKKLQKFGKKPEIGKSKKGDPRPKQEEQKTLAEKASPFGKGLLSGLGKKKKKSDMQKEIEKRSGQTAEEMYGMGIFGADPGGPMSSDLGGIEEPYGTSDWRGFSGPLIEKEPYGTHWGFKHGGRLKKAKKRKRAALRGHRAELRGG